MTASRPSVNPSMEAALGKRRGGWLRDRAAQHIGCQPGATSRSSAHRPTRPPRSAPTSRDHRQDDDERTQADQDQDERDAPDLALDLERATTGTGTEEASRASEVGDG